MKKKDLALTVLMIGLSLGSVSAARADDAKRGTGTKRVAHAQHAETKARSANAATSAQAAVDEARLAREDVDPLIRSSSVVVADQRTGTVLFEKNSDAVVPIASITKLMTAMVVLDAAQNLGESIAVTSEDIDTLRGSRSRLGVGTALSREDMLRLALMSSENRAASALGRSYPGGLPAFVEAMNRKAAELGLEDTAFSDPTGLSAANVSSARDLVRMVEAAATYPLIREFSTTAEYPVSINGRARQFRNTNALVRNPQWEIGVSKTGYISEAGRCLVMQVWIASRPMIIVLLDSWGKLTRIGDANRIKRWVEQVALSSRISG